MAKKAVALAPGLVATKPADAVPAETQAPQRKAHVDTAPLNFRVPLGFKRQFRIQAAENNMNLTEFLTAMLDFWMQEKRTGRPQ